MCESPLWGNVCMLKGIAGYKVETYDMWTGQVAHDNDRVAMKKMLISEWGIAMCESVMWFIIVENISMGKEKKYQIWMRHKGV